MKVDESHARKHNVINHINGNTLNHVKIKILSFPKSWDTQTLWERSSLIKAIGV